MAAGKDARERAAREQACGRAASRLPRPRLPFAPRDPALGARCGVRLPRHARRPSIADEVTANAISMALRAVGVDMIEPNTRNLDGHTRRHATHRPPASPSVRCCDRAGGRVSESRPMPRARRPRRLAGPGHGPLLVFSFKCAQHLGIVSVYSLRSDKHVDAKPITMRVMHSIAHLSISSPPVSSTRSHNITRTILLLHMRSCSLLRAANDSWQICTVETRSTRWVWKRFGSCDEPASLGVKAQ